MPSQSQRPEKRECTRNVSKTKTETRFTQDVSKAKKQKHLILFFISDQKESKKKTSLGMLTVTF